MLTSSPRYHEAHCSSGGKQPWGLRGFALSAMQLSLREVYASATSRRVPQPWHTSGCSVKGRQQRQGQAATPPSLTLTHPHSHTRAIPPTQASYPALYHPLSIPRQDLEPADQRPRSAPHKQKDVCMNSLMNMHLDEPFGPQCPSL
jgi:hypothetical protein